MRKLNKKNSISNSIEAYDWASMCGCNSCVRSCSCSCNPIREYNSNYDAVSNSRYNKNNNAVAYNDYGYVVNH